VIIHQASAVALNLDGTLATTPTSPGMLVDKIQDFNNLPHPRVPLAKLEIQAPSKRMEYSIGFVK
jgi:hypothetical protein